VGEKIQKRKKEDIVMKSVGTSTSTLSNELKRYAITRSIPFVSIRWM